MASSRPRLVAGGSWLADTVADMFVIVARHGDDAFCEADKQWYKFSSSTGMWHRITAGPILVADLPTVTDDGDVIDQLTERIDR